MPSFLALLNLLPSHDRNVYAMQNSSETLDNKAVLRKAEAPSSVKRTQKTKFWSDSTFSGENPPLVGNRAKTSNCHLVSYHRGAS